MSMSPHRIPPIPSKNTKNPAKASPGFTLLELCTCVAVICLIAALMLPAFKSTLVKSRSIKCINNLKQLGAAINLFAADNDGRLPQSWVYGNDAADNNWWYRVSPYTGTQPMAKDWNSVKARSKEPPFRCPENKLVDPSAPFNPWVSYKMSSLFRKRVMGNTPDLASGFPQALFSDLTKVLLLAEGRVTPEFSTPSSTKADNGLRYTHGNKLNGLFLDGHIESFTEKELEVRWDECYPQ